MSKLVVDANYRFIAAYQEVNARISQRQQALTLYVSLVVSLLAALVALKPGASGGELPVEWLVLGFPVASTSLAFLNYKAERAITNLRRFLASLEQLGNAHQELRSYNTDPQWAQGANKARRYHDYASAVLVAGGNAIGLGAVIRIYPERIAETPVVIWISAAIALFSLLALLLTPRLSYRPIR
ncbi:hypothetical protein [Pseudomonas sp. BN102]|uniref:hypothetical protein n=1 Tax=Pseudomonas sp. BN102 TaxID=2567886 RepID=UPI002455F83F|nr:hypothetical protein [Pseudomonas sp. BN102]MDH4608585.1 hypothetical protein [Pseudomonas sp. BN102]